MTRPKRSHKVKDFSAYLLPTIWWLADRRVATAHQLLTAFGNYRGVSPSQPYRALARLIADGLVESAPLKSDQGRGLSGNRRRSVVALTRKGWQRLNAYRSAHEAVWPKSSPLTWPPARLETALQMTHTRLITEQGGAVYLDPPEVWAALHGAALRVLASHPVRKDGLVSDRLRRAPDARITLPAVHYPRTGQVSLLLEVRPGLKYSSMFRALPRPALHALNIVAPVQIALVGGGPELTADALAWGVRWAARHKLDIQWGAAPSFLTLENPLLTEPHDGCMYAFNGLKSPLSWPFGRAVAATREDVRRGDGSNTGGGAV